jgi:hypothetical protein
MSALALERTGKLPASHTPYVRIKGFIFVILLSVINGRCSANWRQQVACLNLAVVLTLPSRNILWCFQDMEERSPFLLTGTGWYTKM